ncbi:MAG: fasciclin domain-containing protein [Bacteroidota bacterium]
MRNLSTGWIAILLFCVLGFTACEDDDDPIINEVRSISEIVENDDRFSILRGALQSTGLDATLDQDGDFTVFAPTDQAFQDSGLDLTTYSTDELRDILRYHVFIGQTIKADDIQENTFTYLPTANQTAPGGNGVSLLVEKTGNAVTLNGDINVTIADIDGTNGVIHAIDDVLLAPNVVDLAVQNSGLSSLVTALTDAAQLNGAPLVDVLAGDGPFTVFAPDNAAFTAAPSGLNPEQLRDVLLYHVVSGTNVRSDGIPPSATTVQGEMLTFGGAGNAVISTSSGQDVEISFTDIQGTNGVVHLINEVMVPNNL